MICLFNKYKKSVQKRTDFFDNSFFNAVPDKPLATRNKPHNNQLCADLSRFISAYPVVSHFLRFAWQTTLTGLISLVVLPANFWLSFFDGIFLGWWDEMLPIFSFGEFNLVPSFIKALSGELTIGSWVKTMLIGNIAMFLPMGFFLPFVTEKINRKSIFIAATTVPFIIELLQMVFGRSFDIDDLICNFIGIAVGFFIGFAIKNTKQKSKLNVN